MASMNFEKVCRKVIGAGANYLSFIQQTGAPRPDEPIIFLKPSSTLLQSKGDLNKDVILIPKIFTAINFEAELGIVIGKHGKNISKEHASDYISGYCLTLDMTGMEFISKSREKKLPWALGKSFDTATPVSSFISKQALDHDNVRVWCKVNGVMKQDDTTKGLLFPVPELIEFISKYMSLEENDIILTGTPVGAGAVNENDIIECGLGDDIATMKFVVKKER